MYIRSFAKLFRMLNIMRQKTLFKHIKKSCKILKKYTIIFFRNFGKNMNKCRSCAYVIYKSQKSKSNKIDKKKQID